MFYDNNIYNLSNETTLPKFSLFVFLLIKHQIIISHYYDKNSLKQYINDKLGRLIKMLNSIDRLNNLLVYVENIKREFEYFLSVLTDANLFIKTFKPYLSDKTINNSHDGFKNSKIKSVFNSFTEKQLINGLKSNGYSVRLARIDKTLKDYGKLDINNLKKELFLIYNNINETDYDNKSGLNIQIKFLNDSMIKLIDMAKTLYRNKFAGSSTDINNELLNLYKDMSGKVRIIYDLLPNYEQFKKMLKYFTELKMFVETGIKQYVQPTGGAILKPKINSNYIYTPKERIKTNHLYLL